MTCESDTAERERDEAILNERRRQTFAELLKVRGNLLAAGVVAGSECQLELVDNWDGGQYELVLAVPADVFDLVDESMSDELNDAAEKIVGREHYAGMHMAIRFTDVREGRDRELIASLRSMARQTRESVRVDVPGLES